MFLPGIISCFLYICRIKKYKVGLSREDVYVVTKEEAVEAAIRVLKELEPTKELQDIIRGLEKFRPGEYRRKWTRSSVYEAVKLWSTLHGRIPSTKELEWDRSLPGAFAIHREYHMSSAEFLRSYFRASGSGNDISNRTEKQLEQFKEEYNRIVPRSARDYNQRRCKGTPTWNRTAKAVGVTRWTELLLLADVDITCLKQVSGDLRNIKSRNVSGHDAKYQVRSNRRH